MIKVPQFKAAAILAATAIPLCAHGAIREIIVPNGSFETMMTENASNEFVIPYVLSSAGITNVTIGGDDWGPNNLQVETLGWYSYEDGRGDSPLYVFSPMHHTANDWSHYNDTVNGRVIVAVNPHNDSFGATDLGETAAEGVYSLSWGSGWSLNTASAGAVPNVDVILQYKVDATTWADLSGASTVSSNKEAIQAMMTPGEFRNDFLTTYTVESGSAAIGAELRVYIPCSTADSGAAMDNVRLYHSTEGDVAIDLGVNNHSVELMYSVPAGTPLPNIPRGDDPFTTEDYSEDYLLTGAGITRVPFGGDNWGPNNIQVWTPGWEAPETNYKFSPMSYYALYNIFSSGFDLTTVGFVLQAINPNASTPVLATSEVKGRIVEGNYSIIWGSGWSTSASSYLPAIASLEYSLDNGDTWMSLDADADAVTSNQAAKSASITSGQYLSDFQTVYTIGASSPALGGILRVAISTNATEDGGVGDRYRVAYVGAEDPHAPRGPGVFSKDELRSDGWLYSDRFGWVAVSTYPWIYSFDGTHSKWIYIDENSYTESGAWVYILR